MTERAILNCLKKHIKERYLKPPTIKSYVKRCVFKQQSYQKWAALNFLQYLENSDLSIIDAIEEYIRVMDIYACNGNTEESRYMFSVAYDVASDLATIAYSL